MNRREAIAALVALPQVARISVTHLEPNDVIVFECEGYLNKATAELIEAQAAKIWPGRKCIVMDKGMTLKVVKG